MKKIVSFYVSFYVVMIYMSKSQNLHFTIFWGGLGRKGSRRGIPGGKACRKHAAQGEAQATHLKGKRGGKGARQVEAQPKKHS